MQLKQRAPPMSAELPSLAWRWATAFRTYQIAKPHEGLDAVLGVCEQVIGWAPRTWFAEHDDSRSAKAKDRLFFASLKRFIERMNLDDSANR